MEALTTRTVTPANRATLTNPIAHLSHAVELRNSNHLLNFSVALASVGRRFDGLSISPLGCLAIVNNAVTTRHAGTPHCSTEIDTAD